MDISTIATTALTTLSPFLVKGGEAIFQGIGKDLWELMKKPFKKDREKVLIERLESNPEDEATQGAVQYQLEGFLEEDQAFAQALAALLAKPELQEAAKQITLINVQNAVVDSDMKAGGDIIIGGSKSGDSKPE